MNYAILKFLISRVLGNGIILNEVLFSFPILFIKN